MTIVFFARRFHPLIGGVEKHVLEISKQLVSIGHKVIVVTEASDHLPRFEKLKKIDIEIYRLKIGKENKNKKFRVWKELWKIRNVIEKADIIHCHDVFFWYLPFRLLYPHKPVYTTFHGYESYPINKKAISIRKVSEKLSAGNICIGDFIPKWYGTKPSYISYGAVDIVSFKKRKIKNDSALFIGRLDDQTGILTYAQALDKIKKSFPTFAMSAYGEGVYKKNLTNKVTVMGFQTNPEKHFADFHFAFVSRYLSILEAFAAKKLVFAVYDNPIKEDYLRMAPYANNIIIVKTPNELSEKVIYMLNHPEEEKVMVEKAYDWVREQTWRKLTLTYLKLWQK